MTVTHRMSSTPEWLAWHNAQDRCLNPRCHAYPNYGGRGITFHAPWVGDFMAFYREVGPKPTPKHQLDRINNEMGYIPGNCRWATPTENRRNTRKTRFITAHGATRPLTEWAEMTGISDDVLRHRIKAGWSPEDTVSFPANGNPDIKSRSLSQSMTKHRVEHNGRWLSLKEACAITGITLACAYKRIGRYGKTVRQAVGLDDQGAT